MRSPRAAIYEQIRSHARIKRYIDVAFRFRVYRRDPVSGDPRPAELLPRIFGGAWDTRTKTYISDTPEEIEEISLHPGQIDVCYNDHPGIRNIQLIGAPGGGKTDTASRRGLRNLVLAPAVTHGMVSATHDDIEILWNKVVDVLPKKWIPIDGIRRGDHVIEIITGANFKFVSAKKQSHTSRSPIAGRDWWSGTVDEAQYIDDEAIFEIWHRGRINKDYQVVYTGNNEYNPQFSRRVAKFAASPTGMVIRVRGPENVFTPLEYWEGLKKELPPDVYKRKVEALDVAPSDAVWGMFSPSDNLRPAPVIAYNVTNDLVRSRFPGLGAEVNWILGTDFGATCTATIALQAFRNPDPADDSPLWWARHEITTRNKPTDYHAAAIVEWCKSQEINIKDVFVLYDPHGQQKQHDKSDVTMMRKAGLLCSPSSTTIIKQKHRINMGNALMCDSNYKRHAFLESDANGQPVTSELYDSLMSVRYDSSGNPDKNRRHGGVDQTHHADAFTHGVFPFEKIRGNVEFSRIRGDNDERSITAGT